MPYLAPDIENYQIPTAVVSFKKLSPGTPEVTFRDMGNCIGATQDNEVTKKEHFAFRGGKKKRDRTDIDTVKSTGKIRIDEIIPENLALWALGTPVENTDGTISIKNLSAAAVTGVLKIVQDNDRGPQVTWEATVSFTPAASFNFIGDDYNVIELDFDIEEDDAGDFGEFTFPASA